MMLPSFNYLKQLMRKSVLAPDILYKMQANLVGETIEHILKQVAARHLPDELIHRPKQGFGFPLAIWMRDELSTFLRRLFAHSRFIELGLFDGDYIHALLEEHLHGKADHNFRLWALMNLEIWYRMSFEGESVDSMKAFIDELMVA